MGKTVLQFGLGGVGKNFLVLLSRYEDIDKMVACDVDERGAEEVEGIAVSSAHQRFCNSFEFYKSDLRDIDATARLLDKIKPDVVFCAVSLLGPNTTRNPKLFPFSKATRDLLWEAGFAAELPFNLLLPDKLMQAVAKAGIQTHVVNCSFPDVVGPAIWKHLGFGPTVGLGNSDNRMPIIRRYVSTKEEVPVSDVCIYLVSCHAVGERGARKAPFFVEGYGDGYKREAEGTPFFLKIMLGDRDITHKYDGGWLIDDYLHSPNTVSLRTASSAVKNVMAILRDTNEFTHANAPNGLIGGYPARINAKGVKIILPQELTLEQAIKINEDAEKHDGVENIKDDGTIVFTDKTYNAMKELGYDCKELPFDELEPRGQELLALYKQLSAE